MPTRPSKLERLGAGVAADGGGQRVIGRDDEGRDPPVGIDAAVAGHERLADHGRGGEAGRAGGQVVGGRAAVVGGGARDLLARGHVALRAEGAEAHLEALTGRLAGGLRQAGDEREAADAQLDQRALGGAGRRPPGRAQLAGLSDETGRRAGLDAAREAAVAEARRQVEAAEHALRAVLEQHQAGHAGGDQDRGVVAVVDVVGRQGDLLQAAAGAQVGPLDARGRAEAAGLTWPRGQLAAVAARAVDHGRRRRAEAGVEDHARRLQGALGVVAVEHAEAGEVAVVAVGLLAHVVDQLAEQEARELQREGGAALIGEGALDAGELAVEGDLRAVAAARVGEADGHLTQDVAAEHAADERRRGAVADLPAPRDVGGVSRQADVGRRVEAEAGDRLVGRAFDRRLGQGLLGGADLEAAAHRGDRAVADEGGDRAAAVDHERQAGVGRTALGRGGADRRATTGRVLAGAAVGAIDEARQRGGVAAAERERAPELADDEDLVLRAGGQRDHEERRRQRQAGAPRSGAVGGAGHDPQANTGGPRRSHVVARPGALAPVSSSWPARPACSRGARSARRRPCRG
ncbi:hypothetical protein OV079_09925 [Nannocystis pusilla]|uniref:Uncharacterized protein n=1 Tax=Nannocystis pusilla TaxID=889268 RepID=A0A9X3EMF9_9BACT|nr:hypothetical protein [Nannocystis pusilla]MCY1005880.1 hypothetical protein [Nannocystis pusilla]